MIGNALQALRRNSSLVNHCRLQRITRPQRKPALRRRTTSEAERSDSSSFDVSANELVQRIQKSDTAVDALAAWMKTLSPQQRRELAIQLPAAIVESNAAAVVPQPSFDDLKLVVMNNAIPFIGFGLMDNSILIVAGDAIDTSVGVMLGISTMCAAAIGNILADIAGIMFGTVVEDFAAQLNMPVPSLTNAQRQLRIVRLANQLGCAIGIVIGCTLGMFPLLFIDADRAQAKKREASLDNLVKDVVTEAGSLVGAARTSLFVLIDQPTKDGIPSADGKYLYARYDADSRRKFHKSDRIIPLGRGIVSRAALTGTSWNIDDVRSEPDFRPGEDHDLEDSRSMVVVPVLDSRRRPIAVIQAVNKIGRGTVGDDDDMEDAKPWHDKDEKHSESRSFTEGDVQILKTLATHISVSLQRLYDKEDEEMRLKDTIRMLSDFGLAAIKDDRRISVDARIPLFPDEA